MCVNMGKLNGYSPVEWLGVVRRELQEWLCIRYFSGLCVHIQHGTLLYGSLMDDVVASPLSGHSCSFGHTWELPLNPTGALSISS